MAANLAGMAFLPYYKHIVELLETNKDLKASAKGIFQQMCFAAAGTVIGGVVGGPPGALVGGVVGSLAGYKTVHNYESMVAVVKGLTDEEKQQLVTKIQELVGSAGIESLTQFIAAQVSRELFLNTIRDFASQATKGGA